MIGKTFTAALLASALSAPLQAQDRTDAIAAELATMRAKIAQLEAEVAALKAKPVEVAPAPVAVAAAPGDSHSFPPCAAALIRISGAGTELSPLRGHYRRGKPAEIPHAGATR